MFSRQKLFSALSKHRHCACGFTLLEMLTVIAVLAIAAVMVTINGNTDAHQKVEFAAREVADAFRYARAEAIAAEMPYGVKIEPGIPRFRVARDPSVSNPVVPVFDVYKPIAKQIFTLDLSTSLPGAAITESTSWTGLCVKSDFIFFDEDGRPRCGDPWSVLLVDGTFTLKASGVTRVIKVAGETGRVTVE